MRVTLLGLLLFTLPVMADIDVYSSSGTKVGKFKAIECGAANQCAKIGTGTRLRLRSIRTQVDQSSASALTAAQCGSAIINSAAATATLPEASTVLGCEYTFINGVASRLTVDPSDSTDNIAVLTSSPGQEIRSATAGNTVVLHAAGADTWVSVGREGTWTSSN